MPTTRTPPAPERLFTGRYTSVVDDYSHAITDAAFLRGCAGSGMASVRPPAGCSSAWALGRALRTALPALLSAHTGTRHPAPIHQAATPPSGLAVSHIPAVTHVGAAHDPD